MPRKNYDKLVRDNMIDIIRSHGNVPTYRIVTGDEYISYLRRKLLEEVKEYLETPTVNELSDIHLVLESLKHACHANDEIGITYVRKNQVNGCLEKGIILEYVDYPDMDAIRIAECYGNKDLKHEQE